MHASEPGPERARLLAHVVFTTLIGNADAHGKNLSLLHDGEGRIGLAPLYDTVPTRLWPNLRSTAALRVDGRDQLDALTVVDHVREAVHWGLDRDEAAAVVVATAESVLEHASEVLTDPQLADHVRVRAEALLSSPAGS